MARQNNQNSMLEKYVAQQHNQNSNTMVDIAKNKFIMSIKNHQSS
jgi:hypothetical protein